jgi:ferric-dicitrate binding protein FerR (iron transport regulator)
MITPVLIAKYFEGTCTPDEVKAVDEWRNKHTDNEKTFAKLKTVWEETGKVRPISEVQETNASWEKLSARIKTAPKTTSKRRSLSFILPRAAAAVLIFTTMIIFYLTQKNKETVAVKMVEISTQKGEKRQLILADGSKVWLNAESSIKYQENFTGETRDVYLEGEAYFDVESNPSKPFKVHTGELITRVLGTEFNVQAYNDQQNIVVALDEGKVALNYEGDKITLSPGKQASFSKQTHTFKSDDIANKHNQWRNNVLEFDNVTLAQAVKTIERWFDKKVVVDNKKLEGCLITASFNNPKVEDVVEIITSILSLENEEIDGVYHIKGDNCL